MDEINQKRQGEPDIDAETTGVPPVSPAPRPVTRGGTDAGPGDGPNPAVGSPVVAEPPLPPAVIHAVGDAHPGESNPAAALTTPTGQPAAGDTAGFLAAREAAEEAYRAQERRGQPGMAAHPAPNTPYADTTDDVDLAHDEQGGRSTEPAAMGTNGEFLNPVGAEVALGAGAAGADGTAARLVSKTQDYTSLAQQSESQSGLPGDQGDYERREFGQGQMDELRDDVLVGAIAAPAGPPAAAATVLGLFPTAAAAQVAVQALRDIGIPAADISLLARDLSNGGAAGTVAPAGEGSFRRSSTELPNDEDLPTTVAAQTADSAAAAPGAPGLTESARGGLAGDEGTITRIDSPADAEIYSDYARSDADYRTTAGAGAAQTGEATEVPDDLAGAHVDAGRGALLGGLFGGFTGLLVGLGALAIPGLGPIIAAGPLVGAIAGLLAGGATGGIVGALIDAGVPHEQAQALAGHIERGAVLLSVQTDHLTHAAVVRVLQANGAEEVH